MRGNMHVILVTTAHVVVYIFQHNTEVGAGGMKLWAQLLGVTGELFRLADDLAQAAATSLHELHPVEEVGNHGIAAYGADGVYVAFLS